MNLFVWIPLYESICWDPIIRIYLLGSHYTNLSVGISLYESICWDPIVCIYLLVPYDINIIKPILDHIKIVWANNNEDHYRYILALLAYPIRNLISSTIVLTLVGPQGSGKSCIFDIFFKYIYGIQISHSTSGLDDILQKFNAHLDGKLCIVVNEAEATDGASGQHFGHMFNKFKNFITDEYTAIQPKGQEVRTGSNYRSYYICTQHKSSILIEGNDDRRYAIFETSPIYKGNFEYFGMLKTYCNQVVGNHLYSYFRSPDFEGKDIDIRKIPTTPIRESMIKRTTPYVEAFINEIFNGELTIPYQEIKFHDKGPIFSTIELYASYKLWLKEHDAYVRPKSMEIFCDNLNKCPHLEKTPNAVRVKSSNFRGHGYWILQSGHDLVNIEFPTAPMWLLNDALKLPYLGGGPTIISDSGPWIASLSLYLLHKI
jgi:hypothetical protein